MESSRQSMGAEGCSSSESGWTMYIASPMEEDDCSNMENEANEDGFYGENNNRRRGKKKKDEEDSDDSMASDASSGPTHHHHSNNASASSNKKDKKHHGFAEKLCSSFSKIANKHDKKRSSK
ncbi:uncharacterized protein LOC114734606 [Neltuma alba]|uniref:uncharacterized protein LOC114734606 n=1 Tax=Neltuma alba TaxID=207710 RepID=UPI0010A325E4|nr:uncharacterized protein LOC114734606 [Prosopis alba]